MTSSSKRKYNIVDINAKAKFSPAEFVSECESDYHKRIYDIADYIKSNGQKIIFLAGPSSSGKTTTALKLMECLQKQGIQAAAISLDNFLLNYEDLPRFKDGSVDFDSIDTLDVECFKSCINELIERKTTTLPRFDFVKRGRHGSEVITINDDHIVIIEGIHALNPKITESKHESDFLKLYISVKSELYKDRKRILNSTDTRLIRRLIRDDKFRSSDANNTIAMWNQVCESEKLYIRPCKNVADFWIDSSHLYEMLVYKIYILEVLSVVEKHSKYYDTAERLTNIINEFNNIAVDYVPQDSMIREFIGN